jgi:hypothetical protein
MKTFFKGAQLFGKKETPGAAQPQQTVEEAGDRKRLNVPPNNTLHLFSSGGYHRRRQTI